MASERSSTVAWDDDSRVYEYDDDDDWEKASQSHLSIASAPVMMSSAAATLVQTSRRLQLQGDLKDIQAALAKDESGTWNSKSKFAIAFLLTTVMMLSTVRIRSEESRMATTLMPSSSMQKNNVLTSAMVSKSYDRAGFSTTSQSLDAISISKSLKYLANVPGDSVNTTTDVPFFFHVPRSGGSTIKDILGSCYGMAEATDVGGRATTSGHLRQAPNSLEVVHSEDGAAYVNVDTSTAEGIQRAKTMGLVESHLANVIVSQHLHPAATLFNENQLGRCFTMMRDPIDRAVSMFHYLSVANWEPTYDPSLAYISIEMYARSKRAEHNWMTRFLSNELERDLNDKHLAIAKKVLAKKCVVGLLEHKEESFHRFEKYFRWGPKDQKEIECRDRLLHWGWSNKHSHPQVEEGSVVWDLLYKKNSYDMQLYHFAQGLFTEQGKLFPLENAGAQLQGDGGVAITINENDQQ
jgi:hypothetical protein